MWGKKSISKILWVQSPLKWIKVLNQFNHLLCHMWCSPANGRVYFLDGWHLNMNQGYKWNPCTFNMGMKKHRCLPVMSWQFPKFSWKWFPNTSPQLLSGTRKKSRSCLELSRISGTRKMTGNVSSTHPDYDLMITIKSVLFFGKG